MKEMDCLMKIMEIWMKLDELEDTGTRIYSIDISGTKETKHFT